MTRVTKTSLAHSPTGGLLFGLILTLAAVAAFSWYTNRQIIRLRQLQTELTDRNRKDTLQLLRIQNDLNTVALAMRDILDNDEHYPVTAWRAQFDRIRGDLEDALRQEASVAVSSQTPEQQQYLGSSVTQFWDATDRMFAAAKTGREDDARVQIQLTLQARQSALSTTVARLLVANNEREDETALRVQNIYSAVQRQVYGFLVITLAAISLTSLYMIRANRRLFRELAVLSERRHELAQQLITTRESTLREIARELHDEFGQILTAMGSMLNRAGKHAPEGSSLRSDLRDINEIAQATLDNVRRLSQTLHPSLLEDFGLDETLAWYVSEGARQHGIDVDYQRSGDVVRVAPTIGIHIYRVLQEALSNIARHSGSRSAWVRLRYQQHAIELEVEDRGSGMGAAHERRGLGIVTMAERAQLVGGTIEFLTPPEGGTLVRLRVPCGTFDDHA